MSRLIVIVHNAFDILHNGRYVLEVCTHANFFYSGGTFGKSDDPELMWDVQVVSSYFGTLLLVNAPQLILSFCYFAFNSFFTRLQVEREWSSFSLSHKPLRVSCPVGEQVSSYRLQLPYKYGIPLFIISALMHWTVSNAIFLYILEGGTLSISSLLNVWLLIVLGYMKSTEPDRIGGYFGVYDEPYISIGISANAIFTMLILSLIFICFPIIFSLRKAPGVMVAGGSNSLVLSAACHANIRTIPRGKS